MDLQRASFAFFATLLGISTPVSAQVYRLVPNQASDGYRLHAPNGNTYNVTPNYGMSRYGEQRTPSSYTIKQTPGGNGDLFFRN